MGRITVNEAEAQALCASLRQQVVQSVSETGGHLSSNLGAVELTVALHRVFDTATDRLVFDVGHQCYIHKMLTGREAEFAQLRQYQGLAGFPKPSESVHDAFVAGHASNSVAVAVGMAQARQLVDQDYAVIALLGDGALTGGLAYEGLAVAAQVKGQMLVILNDNGMSISKNVGGISKYLAKQRLKPPYLRFRRLYRKLLRKNKLGRKIHQFNHGMKQAVKHSLFPCSLFEQMGFTYYGPVEGHDVTALTKILQYSKDLDQPVLLHVRSTKGKGYPPAEENPQAFHGVSPFHVDTGLAKAQAGGATFSQVFGETLCQLAQELPQLCAITAAMCPGTGLDGFGNTFPHRLFDVGIAEGCAVAMAGGLAKQGAVPVFAVYSTFLQRGYDMILHDVALQQLHVVFCVDRCGLVGEDGETHHGVFDLAFLSTVPGLTLLAPSSHQELEEMLRYGVTALTGTVALRYPRGSQGRYVAGFSSQAVDCLVEGSDITLVSYGKYINNLLDCQELLARQGVSAQVLKVNQLAPLSPAVAEPLLSAVAKTAHVLVVEDVIACGSLGANLCRLLAEQQVVAQVACVNSGENFVGHGKLAQLEQELGLDPDSLVIKAWEVLGHGKGKKGTS